MGPARRGAAAAVKLSHTIAALDRPEDFLLDVATSGNEDAVELLITALKELDGDAGCPWCSTRSSRRITEGTPMPGARQSRLLRAVRDR